MTAAEIGVYNGGFGEFLLPHCRMLYLVDSWYRHSGFWKFGMEKIVALRRISEFSKLLTRKSRQEEWNWLWNTPRNSSSPYPANTLILFVLTQGTVVRSLFASKNLPLRK